MHLIALLAVLFVCAFVQVTSGFGFALLAMPLVTLALGLNQAAPVVAAAGLLLNCGNSLRLRRHVNRAELLRAGLAGLAGVPAGFWLQAHCPAATVRAVLGCVIVAYAGYSFLQPRGLRLHSNVWALPAGLLGGLLGAAYNISGPPMVVYGTLRDWPRQEFRSTLQTYFLLNGILVAGGHALMGHFDHSTGLLVLLAVPALAAGSLAGVVADRYIDVCRFQQIVKGLILLTGLALFV